MEHKLLILSNFAVARLLKRFALEMGVSERFGDLMAVLTIQDDKTLGRWSAFYRNNCNHCVHDPKYCAFFAPDLDDCHGDTTPNQVRVANMVMLETGRCIVCPALEAKDQKQA